MYRFLAKREMSVWLIIAAIILDAIMIVPTFWSAVMHALAAMCMFAARKVARHEGRMMGTVAMAPRSPGATSSGGSSS